MLAYLRKGETFAKLAAGFGVGTATAWRHVTETVALLAARSPKLRRALGTAQRAGRSYVVINGTLIPIDWVAADRPFYSGKHRRHGMNLQVLSMRGAECASGLFEGAVNYPNSRFKVAITSPNTSAMLPLLNRSCCMPSRLEGTSVSRDYCGGSCRAIPKTCTAEAGSSVKPMCR